MSSFFNVSPRKSSTPIKNSSRWSLSKRLIMSPAASFTPLPTQEEKKQKPSYTPLSTSTTSTSSTISTPSTKSTTGRDLFSQYNYDIGVCDSGTQTSIDLIDGVAQTDVATQTDPPDEEEEESNVLIDRPGRPPKVNWQHQQGQKFSVATEKRSIRKIISETAASASLNPDLLEEGFNKWAANDKTFLDIMKRVVAKQISIPSTAQQVAATNPYYASKKETIEFCVEEDIIPEGVKAWIGEPMDIEGLSLALESCVREIRLQEEQIRTKIVINDVKHDKSQGDKNAAAAAFAKCATLHQYLIPNDPRLHDNIFRDLSRINEARHSSKTFVVDLGNNASTAYVPFPRCRDVDKMKHGTRKYNLLEEITKALDKEGKANETTRKAFIDVLFDDKEYGPLIQEKLHQDGFSCVQQIDPETSYAMLSAVGLNQKQIRLFRRLLRAHYGTPIFASYEKIYKKLGNAYVEPETGVYKNGRERIYYSVQAVDKVAENLILELHECGSSFDHLDMSLNIDHGQGYLRATLTIVARTTGDPSQDFKDSFSVASAKCKGDSYFILANTFAPKINEALWRIRNANYQFIVWETTSPASVNDKYYFTLGEMAPVDGCRVARRVHAELWVNGDLKFFMQATCREGACGYWCFYCQLCQPDWKGMERGDAAGAPRWTNKMLNEYLEKLELKFVSADERSDIATVTEKCMFNKLSVAERMGFKAGHRLLLSAVEIDHYVPPFLHWLLGVGNDAWKHFLAELQAGFETYSENYFILEQELVLANDAVDEARFNRNSFESMLSTSKKSLREELKLPLSQRCSGLDDDEIASDIQDMMFELSILKEDVKIAREHRDKTKRKFEDECKLPENSKAHGQPLREEFENICRERHINFAEYFGRSMPGNGIRRFLEKRVDIVNHMKDYVDGLPDNQRQEPDLNAINTMFDLHNKLFGHMDAFMSFLRTKRFALESDGRERDIALDNAKKHCDRLYKIWVHLGLSETPKIHLGNHMIHHFEGIDDGKDDWIGSAGLSDIAEDDGEHAHQIGKKRERQMGRNTDLNQVACAIAKADACEKNAKVKDITTKLLEKGKRNFKSPHLSEQDKVEEKRAIRMQHRNALLQEPLVLDASYKSLQQRRKDRCRSQNQSAS